MDIIDKCVTIFSILMLVAMFICGILQCVFFFLKLYGVIDWSWLLTFLPLQIMVVISVMILMLSVYEGWC